MKALNALAILATAVLLGFLSALIQAWAMSKLWVWFVAADYGAGPSLSAWYGLAVIFSLPLGLVMHDVTRKKDESAGPWLRVIGTAVGAWLGILMVLGAAWLTGTFLGWIA